MKKSKKLIAIAAALALTVGGAVSVSASTEQFAGHLPPFKAATTLVEGEKTNPIIANASVYVSNITNKYETVYMWVDDTSNGNLRTKEHYSVSLGTNSLYYKDHTWCGGARLRGDSGNSWAAYTVWVDGSVNFG